MSDIQPWLRQAELLVGPLPEWRANEATDKKVFLDVFSDGTQNTLRVKFNVRLVMQYIPPASTFQIYNLSPELRAAINIPFIAVRLRVGWKNSEMKDLFSGSLTSAYSRREGADIVTTISAVMGYGMAGRTYTGVNVIGESTGDNWWFVPGTKLLVIVRQIANNMLGEENVSDKMINVPDIVVGKRGFSCFGKLDNIMNGLARTYGFTWWIDAAGFHAEKDTAPTQHPAQLLSYKNGTLMRAEPVLNGVWQVYAGLSFRGLLDPAILPGGYVQIESKVNPFLNAPWFVREATYTGDTAGGPWYVDGYSQLISQEGML